MKLLETILALMSSFAFITIPVHAQVDPNEDIEKRGQAHDTCASDPNYYGYGTYEVCVEAVYRDLLMNQPPGTTPGGAGIFPCPTGRNCYNLH
jgi:hypothetical protein